MTFVSRQNHQCEDWLFFGGIKIFAAGGDDAHTACVHRGCQNQQRNKRSL